MKYREPLPEGCPPDEAETISNECIVFRLVRNNPPIDCDFKSQRTEKPEAKFDDAAECLARGLSVRKEESDIRNMLRLPKFQNALICRITLGKGAGIMQQTGRNSHQTWWPFAGYNILENCSLV